MVVKPWSDERKFLFGCSCIVSRKNGIWKKFLIFIFLKIKIIVHFIIFYNQEKIFNGGDIISIIIFIYIMFIQSYKKKTKKNNPNLHTTEI